MSTNRQIEQAYRLAEERYAALGVDTAKALQQLADIPISIHCWQGDDVGGFENAGQQLGGGLAVTGNTTPAKPARRTNCGRTSSRPFRPFPAATASTSMPATPR